LNGISFTAKPKAQAGPQSEMARPGRVPGAGFTPVPYQSRRHADGSVTPAIADGSAVNENAID
jgi:hypothetical protein